MSGFTGMLCLPDIICFRVRGGDSNYCRSAAIIERGKFLQHELPHVPPSTVRLRGIKRTLRVLCLGSAAFSSTKICNFQFVLSIYPKLRVLLNIVVGSIPERFKLNKHDPYS